jgi:hypothetical protein
MILAIAAEDDCDFFIWDKIKTIQAEMFAAGPVSIKFAYFGAEGALQSRPYISTRWVTGADDMADLIDRGRAGCVCGCYVNISDILAEALKETQQGPVQAVVIIGDRFHDDLDKAAERAKQLRAAGTRLFLIQQGRSAYAEAVFRSLAELTGGAHFCFNPAIERVAERLPGLLEAVVHFSLGGIQALEALENQAAALLLDQITKPLSIDSAAPMGRGSST